MNTKRLLIIDDHARHRAVLREHLGAEYTLEFASDLADAPATARRLGPELILLNLERFDLHALEACRELQLDAATAGIPVLVFTGCKLPGARAAAFHAGVADYVTRPASLRELQARVRLQLSLSQRDAQGRSLREALSRLGRPSHVHGDEQRVHPGRMAAYAAVLARAAGWDAERCALLEVAATLHDVGEVEVPPSILLKPLKLEAEEWEAMKTHCRIGHDMLARHPAPVFQEAALIALHHHEKWDGSGYPGGLAGKAIPQAARIVAVVDAFDALTTRRPYREAWPEEAAMHTLRLDAGSHFDPELVSLFESVMPQILELKSMWETHPIAAPAALLV
jgi:putative two-component system response regulator